jgi:feruloyl esterase
VAGVIGTETHFELLLPEKWNGKFVMGGGGGFAGSVVNLSLLYGSLQRGYATVGTDTGHQANSRDASWALNNLERVVNFGHQGVHRTAVTAQAMTSAYYGRDASRNYFLGCSRGGGQALMEAQRYPGDFDGIAAGAPAYQWTHELGARNAWIMQAMYPDPDDLSRAVIEPEKTQLIGNAVMDQCDDLDGLEDGILNNPLQCSFDVSSLACESDETKGCLTGQEVEAAKRIYDGLRDQEGLIFPGMPPGGELSPGGWARWFTGGLDLQQDVENYQRGGVLKSDFPYPVTPNVHFAFVNGVMKYLVFNDPDWNYADYSFETFRSDAAEVAPTINATDPELTTFRERGGKLLMWAGWADKGISPLGTIDYYEKVLAHDASAREDVRLIMMPGVDHCLGGAGANWVNYLDEIDKWVTTGEAPGEITAYWINDKRQPDGARPVCAYPAHLVYDGIGNPRAATSFSCISEEQ